MRVLIVADGTRGDVQPMTVFALQLQREGQDVKFVAPPTFRSFVEDKGLPFTPLAFDSETLIKRHAEVMTGGMMSMLRAVPALFVKSGESQLEVLPELAKQADFILAGGIHVGVPSAAEYAGIPWRWVVYTSIMYPSTAHPPMTARLGHAPRIANWTLWQLTRAFINFTFRASINRHRARLGLPALSDISTHILCPNPILAMEPELAPLPPEWPRADIVGYLDPGAGSPLPAELEDFIERGPPPVYIGFGSMPDAEPVRTTQLFVEATRRAGVRAVISRGWADFGRELPEHCIAVGPVSHSRLFPRMAAVVHHGGAGTTAAAARAGIPQLVVPHVADQFFFADRVHALGIGARPIRRPALQASLLAQRLQSLLGDATLRQRAAQLGETIRARPRPEDLSQLLTQPARVSVPVIPVGRRISVPPPSVWPRS